MNPRKKLTLAILVLTLAALACDYLPTPAPDDPAVDTIATAVAATLAAAEEPGVPDDPTPEPPGPLKVVYVIDGNLWYWEDGSGPASQLTTSGDAVSVRLSDDGTIAAFTREYSYTDVEIWAVNTDGTNTRALVTLADFIPMKTMPAAVSAVPSQIEWKPGTHILAFNTRMTFDGPGLFLGDDHHLVDADSGLLSTLLASGDGGDFYYSPDGSKIALSLAENISVVDADGTNRQSLLNFTFVITYSEYAYYPPVSWGPDSSFLRAAIPPADPLAVPADPTAIWHLPADGSPGTNLASIASVPFFFHQIRFSPDTSQIAYFVEVTPGAPPVLDLHFANVDGSGDTVYISGDLRLHGWSTDGQNFIYSYSGLTPRVGRIGDPPAFLPGIAFMNSVSWVDETQFLYTNNPGAGWELWLRELGSPGVMLASTSGDHLRYDFVK